jgi:hypothetical protein
MVSWVPRETVSADGQIVLFWMTRVAGFALGVHVPLGPVLGDELPPHEKTTAIPHAIAAMLTSLPILLIPIPGSPLKH